VRSFRLSDIDNIIIAQTPGNVVNNCALVNISLLNNNSTALNSYFTSVVPGGIQPVNLQTLRRMFQEYTITGVRVKVSLLRDGAAIIGTVPASIEWAYDDMQPLANGIAPSQVNLQAYANYQYGSVPITSSTTRYVNVAALKRRLGISWCASDDTNYTYQG
jgi:hypothetical protein